MCSISLAINMALGGTTDKDLFCHKLFAYVVPGKEVNKKT